MRPVLLSFAFVFGATAVFAQQIAPPAEHAKAAAAAEQFEKSCNADCLAADQACARSGQKIEACDTRAVVCDFACYINSYLYRACAKSGTTTPVGKDGLAAHCAAEVADNVQQLRKQAEKPRAPIVFAGDGKGPATAISVSGARHILEDLTAKRRWMSSRLPAGSKMTGLERADQGGKSYDVMLARLPDGSQRKVFFQKFVDPPKPAGK